MKPADIRAMTVDQIDDEVLKLKKEHFNLRFRARQRAVGKYRARPRSAPRHCAIEDGCALKTPRFGDIQPGAIKLERGRFGQVEVRQVEVRQVETG